ncbi:MAG: hypothetical protein AAF518_26955, partial [Spirochaetota bacterium]
MNKKEFLLYDKIELIESNFVSNGWLTISQVSKEKDDSCGMTYIYCSLISKKNANSFYEKYDWPIELWKEKKPDVSLNNEYKTYALEGIEPFIFKRIFPDEKYKSYFDISEEFILYFNLYEELENKQNRKYYFIDEFGEKDEVIVIATNTIRLKLKYLKEYISMREMTFVVSFEFTRFIKQLPDSW